MRGHPNVRVVIDALRRIENAVHVTWNEFKNMPRRPKHDHFADEPVDVAEMRERRWPGDTLSFVDALSRIPVVMMLKYEKRQLEFWRENCDREDSSRDMTDRRISEITSLLDCDQTSLLEIRGNVSCVDVKEHMDIITKKAPERRKKRPHDKIKELKSKSSERVKSPSNHARCDNYVAMETEDEVAPSSPNEDDVHDDQTSRVETKVIEDHHGGEATRTRNVRRQRKRPSVDAKMNKAIHRRTRWR